MSWPTCFSGRFGWWDRRKCPLELKARMVEKLVEKIYEIQQEIERNGRPQQVTFYRAGGETGGLGFGGEKGEMKTCS